MGESKWENSLISTLVAPEVTKYTVAPFFLCAYCAKDLWCLQVSLYGQICWIICKVQIFREGNKILTLLRKTIAKFLSPSQNIWTLLDIHYTWIKKIQWIGLIIFGLEVWDSGIGKLTIGYNKKIRLPKYSYPSMSHSPWSFVS